MQVLLPQRGGPPLPAKPHWGSFSTSSETLLATRQGQFDCHTQPLFATRPPSSTAYWRRVPCICRPKFTPPPPRPQLVWLRLGEQGLVARRPLQGHAPNPAPAPRDPSCSSHPRDRVRGALRCSCSGACSHCILWHTWRTGSGGGSDGKGRSNCWNGGPTNVPAHETDPSRNPCRG